MSGGRCGLHLPLLFGVRLTLLSGSQDSRWGISLQRDRWGCVSALITAVVEAEW
jgi:hypothetical protein